MCSACRGPLAVVIVVAMMVVVVGGSSVARQQGPFACWSCSANTQDHDCYDLDHENKTLTKICEPEETFCTVNRIWYIVEAGVDARNFSVNRTCALACSPSCVVIGDRTKIHSCTSCCTTSYCNMGSSASVHPTPSSSLVWATLLLVAWVGLPSPMPQSLQAG